MARSIFRKIVGLLRSYARWFVALAWLMLVLAFPMWVLVRAASGIAVFYHPLHRNTPYHLAHIGVADAAVCIAIIVALGSSIAMLLRRPLLASTSVVLALVLFPIGAKIRLSLVEPGPQQFQRYVGDERFIIPWTFNPRGDDKPNSFGLVMQLCVENLRGNYDPKCRNTTQLTVTPSQRDFQDSSDMNFFQEHVANMKSLALRNNHQGYEYAPPPGSNGNVRVNRYYLLRDDKGQPIRLTDCSELGVCGHTALIDRYRIKYSMKDTPASDWQAQDRKFADLINSWRAPDSN